MSAKVAPDTQGKVTWTEKYSEPKGCPYWMSSEGVVSWTDPTSAMTIEVESLGDKIWVKGYDKEKQAKFWSCAKTDEKVWTEPTTGTIRDAHHHARLLTKKVMLAHKTLNKAKTHARKLSSQSHMQSTSDVPLLDLKEFFYAWSSVDKGAADLVDRVLSVDRKAIIFSKVLSVFQGFLASLVPVVATLACRTAFFNPLEQSASGEDVTKFCGGILLIIMCLGYVYALRSLLLNLLGERFNIRLEMPMRKAAELRDPPMEYDDMHGISDNIRELADALFLRLPQAHYNLATALFSLIAMVILFDAKTAVIAVVSFLVLFALIAVFERFALAHAEDDQALEDKEEAAWDAKDYEAAHDLTRARNRRRHSEILPQVLFNTLTQCILMATVVAAYYFGHELAQNGVVDSESAAVAVVFYYIFLLYNLGQYHSHTVAASRLWVSGCQFNDDADFDEHKKHIDAHLIKDRSDTKRRLTSAILELKKSKGASNKMLLFLLFVWVACTSFVVGYVSWKGDPLSCKPTFFSCSTNDKGDGSPGICGDLEVTHAWTFNFGCSQAPKNSELSARCASMCSTVYGSGNSKRARRHLKTIEGEQQIKFEENLKGVMENADPDFDGKCTSHHDCNVGSDPEKISGQYCYDPDDDPETVESVGYCAPKLECCDYMDSFEKPEGWEEGDYPHCTVECPGYEDEEGDEPLPCSDDAVENNDACWDHEMCNGGWEECDGEGEDYDECIRQNTYHYCALPTAERSEGGQCGQCREIEACCDAKDSITLPETGYTQGENLHCLWLKCAAEPTPVPTPAPTPSPTTAAPTPAPTIEQTMVDNSDPLGDPDEKKDKLGDILDDILDKLGDNEMPDEGGHEEDIPDEDENDAQLIQAEKQVLENALEHIKQLKTLGNDGGIPIFAKKKLPLSLNAKNISGLKKGQGIQEALKNMPVPPDAKEKMEMDLSLDKEQLHVEDLLKDTDGDGIPDYLDMDAENTDGSGEPRKDEDKDGIPDDVDNDDNNNGISDEADIESEENKDEKDNDEDGVIDKKGFDEDVGNDGINDKLSSGDPKDDNDHDGLDDAHDDDDDNDDIPDDADVHPKDSEIDGKPSPDDKDGDSVKDEFDMDEDGDGIPNECDKDWAPNADEPATGETGYIDACLDDVDNDGKDDHKEKLDEERDRCDSFSDEDACEEDGTGRCVWMAMPVMTCGKDDPDCDPFKGSGEEECIHRKLADEVMAEITETQKVDKVISCTTIVEESKCHQHTTNANPDGCDKMDGCFWNDGTHGGPEKDGVDHSGTKESIEDLDPDDDWEENLVMTCGLAEEFAHRISLNLPGCVEKCLHGTSEKGKDRCETLRACPTEHCKVWEKEFLEDYTSKQNNCKQENEMPPPCLKECAKKAGPDCAKVSMCDASKCSPEIHDEFKSFVREGCPGIEEISMSEAGKLADKCQEFKYESDCEKSHFCEMVPKGKCSPPDNDDDGVPDVGYEYCYKLRPHRCHESHECWFMQEEKEMTASEKQEAEGNPGFCQSEEEEQRRRLSASVGKSKSKHPWWHPVAMIKGIFAVAPGRDFPVSDMRAYRKRKLEAKKVSPGPVGVLGEHVYVGYIQVGQKDASARKIEKLEEMQQTMIEPVKRAFTIPTDRVNYEKKKKKKNILKKFKRIKKLMKEKPEVDSTGKRPKKPRLKKP